MKTHTLSDVNQAWVFWAEDDLCETLHTGQDPIEIRGNYRESFKVGLNEEFQRNYHANASQFYGLNREQ